MLPRSTRCWVALAALCGVLTTLPAPAMAGSENIPPHLIECYQDEGLYHRENRLPHTISVVVSLIKQIESSPGFTMDARSLTLSLLHMFRVDGIERDPEVVPSETTIPFGLKGAQYHKHRILMRNLIPRSSFQFPNETLSVLEKDDPAADPVAAGAPAAPAAAPAAAAADPALENQSAPDVEEDVSGHPDAEVVANGTNAQRSGAFTWGADGAEARGAANASAAASGKLQAGPGSRSARAEAAQSDCPVENGVVYTRWGSVQLGTLLAGIATGFEAQSPFTFISQYLKYYSTLLRVKISCYFSGDLAEVALWRGPKQTVKVGASGKWNSTQVPRWYFIGETNEMTDAEIRGGIDGLIMALNVRDFNNKAGGALKLSTLLERYYSYAGVFDEDYRACERQSHYKDVAKTDVLRAQTTSFASALYDATPLLPTIQSDGLSKYATDAVEELDRTVPTHNEADCDAKVRSADDKFPEAKVNVIVVVDCRWSYDDLYPALFAIAEDIKLHPLGSKITVISGQNHQVLFETSDQLHTFAHNLRENATIYRQCATGMKLYDLLDGSLYDHFSNQLEAEKENNEAAVHANVVVLMPETSYDIPSAEITNVENKIDEYKNQYPDVRFLVFATQEKFSFKILLEDPDKDLITFYYNAGTPIETADLSNRIKRIPRRIANPVCGIEWKESQYDRIDIYESISDHHTAYYRIHPRYLFGIDSETIKISEKSKGTVNICYSRTNEYPHDDDSDEDNDSECTSLTGSETEIVLNTPCAGSNTFETCNPLYISVEVTESELRCNDIYCRDVDDVTIEIRHSRLTCGAAALRSPISFAIAAILIFFKVLFSS
ncbi:CSON004543 protein [Gryllus bimaculatus]|nr:CSON004543 protein [Gryllus bimaculatus]